MAGPDFTKDTRDLLAFRAGLICNNPSCYTLTIGPSETNPLVAAKVGEAAHIRAARDGQARYDENMDDNSRAHIDNGIWLCASCHTLIDKDGGKDFKPELLIRWKKQHEQVIRSLLLSRKSPLARLRQFTEYGAIAQEVVTVLEGRGAFFEDFRFEMPIFVVTSVKEVRQELLALENRVEHDNELRGIISNIASECRRFMNKTSTFGDHQRRWNALQVARDNIGVYLARLRDEYGCKISGDINRIIP